MGMDPNKALGDYFENGDGTYSYVLLLCALVVSLVVE